MSVQVRIIDSKDVPEPVWDWVRTGNYDGITLGRDGQHKVMLCPLCGGYGVIVWAWRGGHGKHYAWRCMADRHHQGPLVKIPFEEAWCFGQYVHPGKLRYDITPVDMGEAVAV
jgi:hypothetical protein